MPVSTSVTVLVLLIINCGCSKCEAVLKADASWRLVTTDTCGRRTMI